MNLKIVDGQVYEYKPVEGEFEATVHDLGNGHREVSIRQVRAWVSGWELDPAASPDPVKTAFQLEEAERERQEANALRAARRAKTRVRRLVKSLGCDCLLTLTYRANMTDRETCMRHLKEFVRRIRRVLPGWCYVAAFEQQKRGAWHIHMATHALPRELPHAGVRVKSYSVVRAIWRSVAGEFGGNIDQARRKRASQSSPAKLAGYLSKYMVKAFEEGDAWANRFSASTCSIPDPVKVRFRDATMRELVAWAFSQAGDGRCSPWLSEFKDTFFLTIEGVSHPPPAG